MASAAARYDDAGHLKGSGIGGAKERTGTRGYRCRQNAACSGVIAMIRQLSRTRASVSGWALCLDKDRPRSLIAAQAPSDAWEPSQAYRPAERAE